MDNTFTGVLLMPDHATHTLIECDNFMQHFLGPPLSYWPHLGK